MLSVVIADDEPLARKGLRQLCARHPEIVCVGEASDGDEALRVARVTRPDILFLDIAMPGMDGLAVSRALESGPLPCIVLVTAYDDHALEAYASGVFDYLVKPVETDRFDGVLERARAIVRGLARPAVLASMQGADGRVAPAPRVVWVEARDYYAQVHADGGSFLVRESLASIARRFSHAGFLRVHRSALVNLSRIAAIRRTPAGLLVVMDDGATVPVSRRRRNALAGALRAGGTPTDATPRTLP